MSQGVDTAELERRIAEDPGAAAFPALAENHRRHGDARQAEGVARAGLERRPDALAGRVALGLALLDQGRLDEARAELERVLASVPDHPLARAGLEASLSGVQREDAASPGTGWALPIDGGELDAAFDEAVPEEDEMVSADSFAASAIQAAEREVEENLVPVDEADEFPVATHTVADLLEVQGHADDAQAMRAELAPPASGADPSERARVLATLERWLDNLQRGRT